MKRFIFYLLLSALFIIGHANAQTHKQYDKVKERVQQGLNVDEATADSTATILKRYFTRVRSIRGNEGMSDQNKQQAIKRERRQEIAKLRTFLSADQLKKLRQMVQQYRDMRQQNNQDPADSSLSKYYF